MDELYHYGMPRRSGRYPWGSGDNPHQHDESFLKRYREDKAKGMTEKEIAEAEGMSTTQLRANVSLATTADRKAKIDRAMSLRDKGLSVSAIGREMGINESSVRSLLNPTLAERTKKTEDTANQLRKEVDKHKYIDIGSGVEISLGVNENRLKNAVALLEAQGYKQQLVYIDQMGTNHKTTMKVLTAPDVDYSDLMAHKYDIFTPGSSIIDVDGSRKLGIEPPKSIDSSRIKIRYREEGGIDKDGVIEIRRGVDDLSLGGAKYAQVRIAVDGTHYLKGMAMYSDDIPDGYDVVFNTNKHLGTPMLGSKDNTVLKNMKNDPDNPFGASIKIGDDATTKVQRYYIDANGKKQLSAINVCNEEGDWDKWSKNLASQFLSKQSPALAKKQLDEAFKDKKSEFDEIMSLENSTVRKKLLESFSDDCDSAAVDLKAAPIKGQTSKVILPLTDIPDNKIYAPGYNDGDKLCLVRYPHGGTFEIPELTVDNKISKSANKNLKNAIDAVGISAKVAEQLSGADFDGDTVICIPTGKNGINIRTSKPLKELVNFDPKESYKLPDDAPTILPSTKQKQMGVVSNLINDMTLQGAPTDEIARAVKHSMVVIDSEKHHLDYKKSAIDNNIDELKVKYQNGGGAGTLISRAKSELRVPERKEFNINIDTDPETGAKKYRETGGKYTKNGKEHIRQTITTKMAETDDAYTLVSKANTQMERIYADYANNMKALANRARREYIHTPSQKYSPEAKKIYAKEVESLDNKLMVAKSNAPKERRAQLIANQQVAAKVRANPELKSDNEHLKKLKGQEIARARIKVGAKKETIKITDREWEAIQNGAISGSKLMSIIDNSDLNHLKKLATPRTTATVSTSKVNRIKALASRDCTISEIADALNLSPSTVSKILNE